MSIEFYRFIHVLGFLLIAVSFGFVASLGSDSHADSAKHRKFVGATHGIGLLLLLVAGFGLIAKQHISWPFPWWVFLKLAIWLALAAGLPILRKRPEARIIGLVVCIGLMAIAAFLGIFSLTL